MLAGSIDNNKLASSAITINSVNTSLGGSITLYAGTTALGTSSGSVTLPNSSLANSSVTIGTTAISLGGSSTTLAGLTSVSSTGFTGALTGNASTATTLQTARNINGVSFNGSADITIADSTKLPLAGGTLTGALTLSADPTNALHAATKQYVDNIAAGLDTKASVVVATTANITLSGTQTIDTIAVVAGDRVLVKNQTTTSQNGIYVVAAGAWSRAVDNDSWLELPGSFVFVEKGSQADTGWVCTVDQGGTLGTTAVTWTQFSGAGAVTGGTGISVSGNQVSLTSGVVTAGTYKSLTVDTYGRVTAGTNPTTLAGYGITDAQPVDADLTAIAGLAGTSGFLKKTAADTWALDTSTYLTGNQSITVSGDATGTGTTAIALTLANSGVTAGTYKSLTVDAKGRVTAGTNPTTLAGYGITDAAPSSHTTDATLHLTSTQNTWLDAITATSTEVNYLSGVTSSIQTQLSNKQPLDADLTAIASLAGTSGFLKKTAADTWSLDTNTYLTGNQSITVSGDATGTGTTSIALTLANSGVTASTYKSVTVDAKGRVTAGTNPTTLAGYGITDAAPSSHTSDATLHLTSAQNTWIDAITATSTEVNYLSGVTSAIQTQLSNKQPLDADLTAIAALAGTSGFLKKTAADTWALDTTTYLTAYTETDTLATVTGRGATTATMLSLTNIAAQSLTDAAIWAKGTGGAILFDDNAQKRISWNDGGGNFNIRAGNYHNGTSVVYVKGTADSNSGAANILLGMDASDGNITLQVAPIGTPGSAISITNSATLTTTSFSLSATTASTTTGTGALVVAGGAGIGGALNVGGNLAVTGNLTVNGTTTTVNSTTVTIDDPIFTLGGDTAPASDDNKDRGIEFRYHNGTAAKVGFFGFDDSTGKFTFIPDATNTSEVFSGTAGTISANVLESTVATGTAPFAVTSTTAVTNLNADMVDGKHVGTSGNTIPLLDGTNTWTGLQSFYAGIKNGAMTYPIWEGNLDFGANVANTWLKIVGVGLEAVQYSTIAFKIEITDPNANHGVQGSALSPDLETYFISCDRSDSTVLNTPDMCYVYGPSDRIRAIKTAVGTYEIQIQNETQYREYYVKITPYAINANHSVTYYTLAAGGTATATYNATVGNSIAKFEKAAILNTTASTSTTTGALTVSGGLGVTGTVYATGFNGALTGNASTATTLQTARTINGVSFDGSANITVADSTKLPLTGGTLTGGLVITTTANASIELGRIDGTASTPFIDFHSGATATDYDSRIIANGGNGTAGNGSLVFYAAGYTFNTGSITGNGSGLTSLNASNLSSGTIPSAVLGNSTHYVGTTAIALNRASATQTLTGVSIDGNAGTATTLQTARTINGVSFNGSANITVADSTKLPLAGGTLTGALTLAADPTTALQAATKQYVDNISSSATIVSATSSRMFFFM
jgi:hypothetical protein